jgi:shikimate kinase
VGSRDRRAPPSSPKARRLCPGKESPANIVLTGFMGSGKSSVGRSLARLLGWRFRDLDSVIAKRAGMGVAALFARRGEKAFREMERRAISALRYGRGAVVATGGGAPMRALNRAMLRRAGLVVYLKVAPSVLARRLGTGRGRPLLRSAGGDRRKVETLVRGLLRKRSRHYMRADLVFAGGRGTPAAEARSLARILRARYPGGL